MAVSLIRAATISEIRLDKSTLDASAISFDPSRLDRRKHGVSSPFSSLSLPPIAMATDEVRGAPTSGRVSIVCGTNVLSQKYQNYRHFSLSESEDNGGYRAASRGNELGTPAPLGNEINNNAFTAIIGQMPSQSTGDIKRRVSFVDDDNVDVTPAWLPTYHQYQQPPVSPNRRGSLPGRTRTIPISPSRQDGEESFTGVMAKRTNAGSRRRQIPNTLDVGTGRASLVAVRRQSVAGVQGSGLLTAEQNTANGPRVRDGFCKSAPPLINLPRQEQENLRPTHKTFNYIYNDDQQCSEMIDQPIIGGIPTGDEENDEVVDEIGIDGLSDSFPVFSDDGDIPEDEGNFLTPITERALSTTGEESPQDRGLRILRWIMEEQERPDSTAAGAHQAKETGRGGGMGGGGKEQQPPLQLMRKTSTIQQGKPDQTLTHDRREPQQHSASSGKGREVKRTASRGKLLGKT